MIATRSLVVALLALSTSVTAQSTRSLTLLGTVRDDATGRPIAGARITVLGTAITADTDGVGRYQLHSLNAGTHRLRIEHAGHATNVERITLSSDSLTVAHFHLPALDAAWARLTLGGRAPAGNEDGRSPRPAPPAAVSDLLQGLAPGLGITRGSGQVGSGLRIRIRGINSFVGARHPLVFIDGIRVEYALGGPGIPGLAGPTALDLLEPSMIERIEVLRGPDAMAYGLNARNGVILITTRGR